MMHEKKITGTPLGWVKRLTIGGISGVVTIATAIIGFRYDNIQIHTSLSDSTIENNAVRNVVVFSDSRQNNLADLPLLPEFSNPTNGTINDLTLKYSIASMSGTDTGLSISSGVMFSENEDEEKTDFSYRLDKLMAFNDIGSPFLTMLQKKDKTSNTIDIFCSHKGIKKAFRHKINIYTYYSGISDHNAWKKWCQEIIEKNYSDDSFEICHIVDEEYTYMRQGNVLQGKVSLIEKNSRKTPTITHKPTTTQKTHETAPQSAEQSEKQSAAQPATKPAAQQVTESSAQTTAQPASHQQPVSQQPARKPAAPIDVKYTFNNPDISFSVTKCAYAGGTVYVDLIITNNSGASLSNAYLLQQEPCAGYESWNCKAYDDQGNAYDISRVKASGNDRGIGSNYPLDLPDGVPVKARLYISGVSSNAESFSLLKLAFRGMDTAEPYGAALLQLKNIPFTK